jgi:hypothetical protein
MATNKVVNGGLALIVNRFHGAGTEPVYIGWGSGTGTTAVANTTLFTEKAADISATTGTRVTGSAATATTTATGDTWRLTGTITATGAGTITNAGCFDNATIGSGTLHTKGDFTGIALLSTESIAFTIDNVYVSG